MTDDRRLIAYLDGEMSSPDRLRFEAEMTVDADLAARVARHRRLAEGLATTYAPVLDEAVPQHLLAAARAGRRSAPVRLGLPAWAAIAAALVMGLALGMFGGRFAPMSADGLTVRDGQIVAQGALASALNRRLAAEPGIIRVGLSFRAADGRYCRTFQSPPDRVAGVACRWDDRWIAQTTARIAPFASPEYRTAGSETPPAVLASVDALIVGDPLDAAAERVARDHGWRP